MSTTPTPPVCRGAGETAAEHFGEGAAATDSAMPAPEKDKHGKGEAGLAEAHASEEREEVAAAAGEQRRGGRSKRGAPTEDGGTPKIKNPQKKPRGGKRERADENAAVEIEMTPASKEGTVGAGAGDKASERQEIPEEKMQQRDTAWGRGETTDEGQAIAAGAREPAPAAHPETASAQRERTNPSHEAGAPPRRRPRSRRATAGSAKEEVSRQISLASPCARQRQHGAGGTTESTAERARERDAAAAAHGRGRAAGPQAQAAAAPAATAWKRGAAAQDVAATTSDATRATAMDQTPRAQ